jgi:uncharacterized protein with NRDE domain
MCLIVFAWQPQSAQPLVLAANRDEFHARPSAAADYWRDAPQIVAGRDLEAGGTWLGVSRSGRFAAVTNVRDPAGGSAPRSRGELTRDFLQSAQTPENYLAAVAARGAEYQGFNLLLSDGSALWYLRGGPGADPAPRALAPGLYGLSNAALDVPWPKVKLARHRLAAAIAAASPAAPSTDALRATVADRRLAAADELAGHGLEGEMARQLSAQFIVTPGYGTRCCTTLVWHRDGRMDFTEQRFAANGESIGESSFELSQNSG